MKCTQTEKVTYMQCLSALVVKLHQSAVYQNAIILPKLLECMQQCYISPVDVLPIKYTLSTRCKLMHCCVLQNDLH